MDISMNINNDSTPIQRYSFTSNTLNDVLTRSLYDENAYKKKISEKGKQQLIHIKFNKNDSENINTICPIMQTDLEEEQYIIRLPCNHSFIPFAINKWLDEKPECPVCRHQLDSVEIKRYEDTTITNDTQNINENTNNMHSIFPNRQTHRRIHLAQNSYLDYIYDDLDNDDFQRALILSYRELTDNSNNYDPLRSYSYDLIYNETSTINTVIHIREEEEEQEKNDDNNDNNNDSESITFSSNSNEIYNNEEDDESSSSNLTSNSFYDNDTTDDDDYSNNE
jgi:hypothetical protein